MPKLPLTPTAQRWRDGVFTPNELHWLEHGWRFKSGGNAHRTVMGFKLVVFGRWDKGRAPLQVRVLHRESGVKRFSCHCRTYEEAQLHALDLLMQMIAEGFE
jgi:hypothetical protein